MNKWNLVLFINLLVSLPCFSQKIDTAEVNSQLLKANTIFIKQPYKAKSIANWAIDTSRDGNYLNGIIEGNTILSKIKYYEGDIEGALKVYSHLIDLAKMKDTSFLPSLYHKRSLVNFELKKHYAAIEDAYDAFTYIKNPKTDVYNIRCNILLSDIYEDLGNFKKAISYAKDAYYLAVNQKDSVHISYASGILGSKFLLKQELGSTFLLKQELDSACKYLDISKINHNPQHKSSIIIQTNYHYYISKYYLAINALDKALVHAKETLKLSRFNDHIVHLSHYTLGKVYYKLNDYKNATTHFEKVLNKKNKTKDYKIIGDTNYHLSKIYYALGQKQKAYMLLDKCNILKDSAQQRDNNIRIAHLSSKYESEKKDNEINKQQLKINKQQAELFKRQQYNLVVTMSLVLSILVIIIILYANTLKFQRRKTEQVIAHEKLKTKDAFIKGEETERKQLSIELHDGINSRLSALKYHIDSEHHNTVIEEDFKTSILNQIDSVVNHVRVISNNLSPSALLHFDLVKTIRYYCNTLNSLTPNINIAFTFVGESINDTIQEDINTILYRIVQELLNNSIKHSQASDIIVQITHKNQLLSLTIEDNGTGFNPNDVENHGLGLKNIKARANYINATFDMVSDTKGTSTYLEIDLSSYDFKKIAI